MICGTQLNVLRNNSLKSADTNEDLTFISNTPLSLETKDDFLLTLKRQRKLIFSSLDRRNIPDLISFRQGGFQKKIADILLTSSNEFSDVKLEAALILAGLTRMVGNARLIDLQDAIIGELIEALRNATEKEFLCDVLLAVGFHGYSDQVRQDLFDQGLKNILILKHSIFSEDIEVMRAILLVLSLVFQPVPPMRLAEFEGLLPILSAALHSSDELTISYAATAWSHLLTTSYAAPAWSHLYTGDEAGKILALDSSIAPTLVQLMMHSAIEVVHPALTAVGNVISGDDAMTETMIKLQVVPSLLWLVDYPNMKIRREALFSLSNIAAGNHSHIQAVIDAGVVPRIMHFMKYWTSESNEETSLYEETSIILGNILSNGSNDQKRYLLSEHVFEAFCDPLRNPKLLIGPGLFNEPTLRVLLDRIINLLRFAKSDFSDSKEIISSLFKKEKVLDTLIAINTSINSSLNVVAWSKQILDLVKELNLE
mmetsp:Transcript_11212/g.12076  ORF Transcript_11212/g.12076 Transcript_11212/m.12076 type:complete len:483 (+) Transcript_11212:10-1458(+)